MKAGTVIPRRIILPPSCASRQDYMGNDQLLPAYNVQIGVADEYIAVVDVNHHKDPFRAVNFPIGKDGIIRCPNGKAFHLQYRQHVSEAMKKIQRYNEAAFKKTVKGVRERFFAFKYL